MSEELKPCPFCGSKNIAMFEGSTFRWQVVQCVDCDATKEARKHDTAMSAGVGVNFERGVEAWNTRDERTVIDGFLARVREAWRSHEDWNFSRATKEVYAEMFPNEQSPSE